MSSAMNPTVTRKMIDELDEIFRSAAADGKIQEVFKRDRKPLDRLMRANRESRGDADMQREFRVPRFIWIFADGWYAAKKGAGVDAAFWARQHQVLEEFDRLNPTAHREDDPIPTGSVIHEEQPAVLQPVPDTKGKAAKDVRTPSSVATGNGAEPVAIARTLRPVKKEKKGERDGKAGRLSRQRKKFDSPGESEEDASGQDAIQVRRPVNPPVQHVGKGKQKKEERAESSDADNDNDDVIMEDTPPPRVPAPKGEGKKRNIPKSTGVLRKPACRRCKKNQRVCLAQARGRGACVSCAKMKMRCVNDEGAEAGEVESEDEEEKTASAGPSSVKPAKPVSRRAMKPSPAKQRGRLEQATRRDKQSEEGTVFLAAKRKRQVSVPRSADRVQPAPVADTQARRHKRARIIASSDEEAGPSFRAIERGSDSADQHEDAIEMLKQQVGVLQQRWVDTLDRYEKASRDVSRLQQDYNNLAKEMREVEERLYRQEEEQTSLVDRVEVLEEKVKDRDERIEVMEDRIRQAQKTWKAMRAEVKLAPGPGQPSAPTYSEPAGPSTKGEGTQEAPSRVVEGDKAMKAKQAERPSPAHQLGRASPVPALQQEAFPIPPAPAAPSKLAQGAQDSSTHRMPAGMPISDSMPPPQLPTTTATTANPVEAVQALTTGQTPGNSPPPNIQPPSIAANVDTVPAVVLLPATPQTSQETQEPVVLLNVPGPSEVNTVEPGVTPGNPPPNPEPATRRSRTRSPIPPASELRRSPRIRSATPVPVPVTSAPEPSLAVKRPAEDSDEQPAAKKGREE